MLKLTKSTTLNGVSEINGYSVASMNVNIYDTGSINFSSNIDDVQIYKSNMAEVRADIEEFYKVAYEIQDDMSKSAETEEV